MAEKSPKRTFESKVNEICDQLGVPSHLRGDYTEILMDQLVTATVATEHPSVLISGNIPEDTQRRIRVINRELRGKTLPPGADTVVEQGGVPVPPVLDDDKLNPMFALPANDRELNRRKNEQLKSLAQAKIRVRKLRERNTK